MAEKSTKEQTERRVYVLPIELVERIREYQQEQSIPSEVEAVRRLLDNSLQMRDSVFSLLNKLRQRSSDEKDIRVLSRDVLAAHPLIRSISVGDDGLIFTLTNGSSGKMSPGLKTYYDTNENGHQYTWEKWPAEFGARGPAQKSSSHLDDDIPF